MYFAGNDGVHGNELWKTDGTAAGANLVKDLNVGNASSHGVRAADAADWLGAKVFRRELVDLGLVVASGTAGVK